MPDCRVEPAAPSDPKFGMLAELLEIDVMHAFGLSVGLWCLCWRKEYLDGRLKRWTNTALATELRWKGEPAKFVEAMLTAEVLVKEADGTLVAKNFSKRQGPLIKKLLADRAAYEERQKALDLQQPAAKAPGAAGDSSGVKLLLDRMRECHVTGTPQQKREHAEAWIASNRAQKAEALIMGDGKGKGIFWLGKVLDGNGAAQGAPSTDEILKKWAREGDAKDAAAKGTKKA